MSVNGVIHIGGHVGQEIPIYKKINENLPIYVFEPHPQTYSKLIENIKGYSNIHPYNIALGSKETILELFVDDKEGQCNSLLHPKLHLQQYPEVKFNTKINVLVKTLDSIDIQDNINFLSMDVQGYELEVLRGSINTIKHINYIMTEINKVELYENGCIINELDDFLNKYQFKRVETTWDGDTWGDAFYIRN